MTTCNEWQETVRDCPKVAVWKVAGAVPRRSGQMFSAPSSFPTKSDATRFLAVVEADIARGVYIDPRAGRVTFTEWSDRWWRSGPGTSLARLR